MVGRGFSPGGTGEFFKLYYFQDILDQEINAAQNLAVTLLSEQRTIPLESLGSSIANFGHKLDFFPYLLRDHEMPRLAFKMKIWLASCANCFLHRSLLNLRRLSPFFSCLSASLSWGLTLFRCKMLWSF
jgi:hypothetical protein